jgi:ABC-2 type transport system permease protein
MDLLASFRKDFLLLLRDRGEMAALFLMPLAFILPICLAFPADGYNLNADGKQPLPIAVYDVVEGQPPAPTQELLDSLGESFWLEYRHAPAEAQQLTADLVCATASPACDEAVVRGRVQRDERNAGLIIPAGLAAAIAAGEHISLTLVYNPARSPADRQLVEAAVAGSAMQLSIQHQLDNGLGQFEELIDLVPADVQAQIRRQVEGDAAEDGTATAEATPAPTLAPAVDVTEVQPSNVRVQRTPNTINQTIPGYTVMFVYFLIGTITASFALERNTGMLRRLLTTPAHRSAFLGGKVLAALLVGVLQVAAMFAIGYFFFHMDLGSAPVALLLLTVAVVLSAVCIGLAAAAYRIERGINIFLIVAALLAGCAFPADWLPPLLRTVNVVLPQTWAMAGYQDLLTRGLGLGAVLPEIGVLLGFAAVFFFLAQRRFRFAASE